MFQMTMISILSNDDNTITMLHQSPIIWGIYMNLFSYDLNCKHVFLQYIIVCNVNFCIAYFMDFICQVSV